MACSIGAIVGAWLGFTFDADAWFAGAVTGGIIGWLVAHRAVRDDDERDVALERRLEALMRLGKQMAQPAAVPPHDPP